MTSQTNQLHFVLFPLMAHGHLIPMIDIAKLLVQRGAFVTLVTTPVNAARIKPHIDHFNETGRTIQVKLLKFPCEEVGLPLGCENLNSLPLNSGVFKFFRGISLLKGQAEDLLRDLKPRPSCIISDAALLFTSDIAFKFNIPKISFHPGCGFSVLVNLKAYIHREFLQSITSNSEFFIFPGFPEEMKITKAHLPVNVGDDFSRQFWDEFMKVDFAVSRAIFNTVEELELPYIQEYSKITGNKAWCIGPVSLCNQGNVVKTKRGNVSTIDEDECLKWLDNQQHGSVLYVCFGSAYHMQVKQMIELGLGLEASKTPFVWVISNKIEQLEKWFVENKFEKRIKVRGLIIRGWAPQLLILSHPSVGGFLNHCGWNSTQEAINACVPLLTWPLSSDHFFSEMLVVDTLKIGMRAGVEHPIDVEDEPIDYLAVKKEDLAMKIEMLMGDGDEARARRERIKELSIMAKKAMEEGGSSYLNTQLLIQEVMEMASNMKSV